MLDDGGAGDDGGGLMVAALDRPSDVRDERFSTCLVLVNGTAGRDNVGAAGLLILDANV